MKYDVVTIDFLNNNYVNVYLDGDKTVYTDRKGGHAWLNLMNSNNYTLVEYKRFDNNDVTYCFSK